MEKMTLHGEKESALLGKKKMKNLLSQKLKSNLLLNLIKYLPYLKKLSMNSLMKKDILNLPNKVSQNNKLGETKEFRNLL